MRIVLADDQVSVRSALRLLLEQEPGIEIVGEAADTTGLLMAVEAGRPDLLLLDWELPSAPTDYLIRLLRHEWPQLLVIALSSRPEARQLALSAGVDQFASKGAPPAQLLAAVHGLLPGSRQ